jgi:hypothetical protein
MAHRSGLHSVDSQCASVHGASLKILANGDARNLGWANPSAAQGRVRPKLAVCFSVSNPTRAAGRAPFADGSAVCFLDAPCPWWKNPQTQTTQPPRSSLFRHPSRRQRREAPARVGRRDTHTPPRLGSETTRPDPFSDVSPSQVYCSSLFRSLHRIHA